eukprot:COSAG02_NODE_207_length_29119_cov_41.071365_9_plen_117_part_00
MRPGTFDYVIPFYKDKAFRQVSLQCILKRIGASFEPPVCGSSDVSIGDGPQTLGCSMTMKAVVDAIKREIGLEASMTPQAVIDVAVEQGYSTVHLAGSLKDRVKTLATEMNIDTGW